MRKARMVCTTPSGQLILDGHPPTILLKYCYAYL